MGQKIYVLTSVVTMPDADVDDADVHAAAFCGECDNAIGAIPVNVAGFEGVTVVGTGIVRVNDNWPA